MKTRRRGEVREAGRRGKGGTACGAGAAGQDGVRWGCGVGRECVLRRGNGSVGGVRGCGVMGGGRAAGRGETWWACAREARTGRSRSGGGARGERVRERARQGPKAVAARWRRGGAECPCRMMCGGHRGGFHQSGLKAEGVAQIAGGRCGAERGVVPNKTYGMGGRVGAGLGAITREVGVRTRCVPDACEGPGAMRWGFGMVTGVEGVEGRGGGGAVGWAGRSGGGPGSAMR